MSIDGILLDLDHTLYDYHKAHARALDASIDRLSQRIGREPAEVLETYARARKEIHAELVGLASSHSRFLYFQRVVEILGLRPSSLVIECEEWYWRVFLDHMVLRDGAMQFLDSVKHLPIAIVTDLSAAIQFRKLAKLNLDGYFQTIVTSEEAGVEKPHPRIFEKALAKLALNANRACMIGDDFKKDIRGAAGLGIRAFWFSDGNARPELSADEAAALVAEFKSFDELSELLSSTVRNGGG